MADYKPHQYTSKTMDYNTRIPAKQLDTRVKMYQPSRPIKDIPPTRTYDTKPPKQITARNYKFKTNDSYTEYVPPWSRGKEKAKRGQQGRKPAKATPSAKQTVGPVSEASESSSQGPREATKATFAPLPPIAENEPSVQALGSVKRMLDLFYV